RHAVPLAEDQSCRTGAQAGGRIEDKPAGARGNALTLATHRAGRTCLAHRRRDAGQSGRAADGAAAALKRRAGRTVPGSRSRLPGIAADRAAGSEVRPARRTATPVRVARHDARAAGRATGGLAGWTGEAGTRGDAGATGRAAGVAALDETRLAG